MAHLSTHVVDQLTAGVLPKAQADEAAAHAAACPDCTAKLAAAANARDTFLQHNPPMLRAENLLGAGHRSPRTSRWWLVPAFAAAASVVIAIVAVPGTGPGPTLDKGPGGPAVSAWVQRPSTGRTWTPTPDERLEPGDRLQLQVSPAGRKHVTVYALDEADGGLTRLWDQPVPGTATLEQSLVLDAQPGPETLLILFSDGPVPGTGPFDGGQGDLRTLRVEKK